ncbi:MAG: asparaginase [Chlorobi bacterium]|nr:asparaginase [Chlorobiota bacterium]
MADKRILIIYTGGTIGMVNDPDTNSLIPFDFKNILKNVPELRNFDFQIDSRSFNPPIDSSDIYPDIWKKLVTIIEESYDVYDGFVILHGTDTMAYTASALSFMLHNLSKPVILTGSQLPLGTIRTDGKENLITALEIAAAQKNGQALVPEVCIYFQDKLFRGNRTTKYNAENFRAFRSDNYPPLAEAGIHLRYNYPFIRYTLKPGEFAVSKEMNTNVALLKLFPGINKSVVDAVMNLSGIEAVVLETFGSGNAPTFQWFLDSVADALSRNVLVLNVTQCIAGSVDMERYATGVHLSELGVISGYDITTESAVTKLMFLLANSKNREEVKKSLNMSLKGEISI